ncbi:MAG: serine hydroxymethyltransferase, partial [Pseudobdellovibrionaceae bacterium]|nr:serine hydroxymethyltransferase [Pseudobdellovibrionaceae bacterium]
MKHFTLSQSDQTIYELIQKELIRQVDGLEMIASENYVSPAVLEAQGSILTNKYAEGYPGKRYYGGCQFIDEIETIAIERAKKLFQCHYANVQPHSGSNANLAVYLSLLKPGDTILGMNLSHGGHLTHGSPVNVSGTWFHACHYGVHPETSLIDYNIVESIAKQTKPKLIIAGYSSYPRGLDFKAFKEIALKVGAYLMVDMAHIAGLVATGFMESPLPYADVVTSTTHKTLRGPRGGLIVANSDEIGKKLNSSIFPGIQGGPLEHVIAAKAVAFGEALDPSFTGYIEQVIKNAKALAQEFISQGFRLVTGGTDNHLLVIDLSKEGISGKEAEAALGEAGITVNKNTIPNDPRPPTVTSGIRLGTPALTTRGMKEAEMKQIAVWISRILRQPL